MSANQYTLLKCEGCGQTLGYIYVRPKIGTLTALYPPRYWPLLAQPPQHEFEKTAFCETCFKKRLEEVTGAKQEPEVIEERDETKQPKPKSRDRSLIR